MICFTQVILNGTKTLEKVKGFEKLKMTHQYFAVSKMMMEKNVTSQSRLK